MVTHIPFLFLQARGGAEKQHLFSTRVEAYIHAYIVTHTPFFLFLQARGGAEKQHLFSTLVEAQAARQSQPVPPAIFSAAAVADNLIEEIDRLALRMGWLLRGLPLARVGVVVYAIALHAWLFLVPFVHLLSMPVSRAHAHS